MDRDLPFRDVWRYTLDEVALLLENVDAEHVVSADHGNAFGE